MPSKKTITLETGEEFTMEVDSTVELATSLFGPLAVWGARKVQEKMNSKGENLEEQMKRAGYTYTPVQFVSLFFLSLLVFTLLGPVAMYFLINLLSLLPILGFLLLYTGYIVGFILLSPIILFINPALENSILLLFFVGYATVFFILVNLYYWGFFGFWDTFPNLAKRTARQRGKTVDLYLPYASTYIASMAAANATMPVIFRSLAAQKEPKKGISLKFAKWFDGDQDKEIYPVICTEAGKIYKDMNLLGVDAVTALANAVARSPSPKMAEFFQGIFSTITSGGNLKKYFLNSAEHYMEDNKQVMKNELDFLSLMAETYVVVGIAMPIFLIIMIMITQWVSKGSGDMDASLFYLIIFVMLPTIHLLFAGILYNSTKER